MLDKIMWLVVLVVMTAALVVLIVDTMWPSDD